MIHILFIFPLSYINDLFVLTDGRIVDYLPCGACGVHT